MYKIDYSGVFLPFPGTSIVASTNESAEHSFEAIITNMNGNKLLREYFKPLPASSLHVTGMNLFCKQDMSTNEWSNFIHKKIQDFEDLSDELKIQAITPEIESFTLIVNDGTISFELELASETREQLQSLADTFDLPRFFIPDEFHITLCYAYNSTPNMNVLDKIHDSLQENVRLNAKKILSTKMEQMKLCFFQDMTLFTPWDGKSNPFKKELFVNPDIIYFDGLFGKEPPSPPQKSNRASDPLKLPIFDRPSLSF